MNLTKTLLTAAAVSILGVGAQAATVFPGENDCAGLFGQPFDECAYQDSPIIYKEEVGGGGEVNSIFPSVTGGEFSWDYDVGTTFSGIWSYILGPDDPMVTAVVAKGGNGFVVFSIAMGDFDAAAGGTQSGTWYTVAGGLSHLSWYDTEAPPPEIPLPAAGWLLIGGLGGLAALRRRKS